MLSITAVRRKCFNLAEDVENPCGGAYLCQEEGQKGSGSIRIVEIRVIRRIREGWAGYSGFPWHSFLVSCYRPS